MFRKLIQIHISLFFWLIRAQKIFSEECEFLRFVFVFERVPKSPGFWGQNSLWDSSGQNRCRDHLKLWLSMGIPPKSPEFRFRNYRTICSDSYGTSRWVSLGNVALMRPWVVYHRAMMRVNMVPSGGVGGDSDADLGGILFLKDGVKLDKKVGLGDFIYIYMYRIFEYKHYHIIIYDLYMQGPFK